MSSAKPETAPYAYVFEEYRIRRDEIRQRLTDFKTIPATDWFYELCFCLCTPQSKAVNAERVVIKLRNADFEARGDDPTEILRSPDHYIRFHNTKARHLLAMRAQFSVIRQQIESHTDAVTARAWLVANVRGIGMKESSHFLRNIGYRDIAIIDRHILTHLSRCGVIEEATAPSTRQRYEEIEQRWKQFASDIRIDMDELDLLFWSLQTGQILK